MRRLQGQNDQSARHQLMKRLSEENFTLEEVFC
jgi:hypothetical protein